MPRVATKPKAPEATEKRARTSAQLANDERLRSATNEKRGSVAPVQLRKMTESAEQGVGQIPERTFDKNSDLPQIKLVGPEGKSARWMEDMAFANEIVRVRIPETTEERANPFPEIWVNGRVQRFVRGQEQDVRRCYVEKLARMKHTAYGSLKTKDVDGEDVYRYPTRTGLVYEFTVIGDSPKGDAWLKEILAEQG